MKNNSFISITLFLSTVTFFTASVALSTANVSSTKSILELFPSTKGYVEFLTVFHYHGFPVTVSAFYGCDMFQAYNHITAYPFKTPRL